MQENKELLSSTPKKNCHVSFTKIKKIYRRRFCRKVQTSVQNLTP